MLGLSRLNWKTDLLNSLYSLGFFEWMLSKHFTTYETTLFFNPAIFDF
jgi:hypothetical protein